MFQLAKVGAVFFIKVIILVPGLVFAQAQLANNLGSPEQSQTSSTNNFWEENIGRFLPLKQVLQIVTYETGVQFRVSEKLLGEKFFIRNLGQSPEMRLKYILDEYTSIEIFHEEAKKKVILLLASRSEGSLEGLNLPLETAIIQQKRKLTTPKANAGVPMAPYAVVINYTLPLEKLQKLAKLPYRGHSHVKLYEDSEYRKFFAKLGINSAAQLRERRQIYKIRKEARKILHLFNSK